MMRVANYIIIITPTPADVINHDWLGREIPAALADIESINEVEYQMLEGAVHKSVVIPETMLDANFELGLSSHGRYFAKSDNVNLDKIKVIGISPNKEETFELKYQTLLKESLGLSQTLVPFKR